MINTITTILIIGAIFIKTYGRADKEFGRCVEITPEGGYLVAGYVLSQNDVNLYIFKTDSLGNLIWEKIYGDTNFKEYGYYVKGCDSGYVIVGKREYGEDSDLYILKINENGEREWERVYGVTGNVLGLCLDRTFDNGFIIGGEKNDHLYLLKTNEFGDSIWAYQDTSLYLGRTRSIESVGDSGYILTGFAYVPCMYAGSYVIRMDLQGNILWTKTYGGSGYPWPGGTDAYAVAGHKTLDGKYITGGTMIYIDTMGSSLWTWLEKIDTDSTTLWSKEYSYAWMKWLEITDDSGFVMVGERNNNVYLIKYNKNGDSVWAYEYNVFSNDSTFRVKQTPDKGYIIVGHTVIDSTNTDIFLIKTDSLGYTNIDENNKKYFYKNISYSLILQTKRLPYLITQNKIYNIFGQKRNNLQKSSPAGIYFVKLKNKKVKLIVFK